MVVSSQRLLKFQASPKNEMSGKSSPDGTGSIIPKTVRFIKKSPSPSHVSPQRSDEGDAPIKVISSKSIKMIKSVAKRSMRG